MKKICILCASEFEAKRSDANYCSEKCRAKANYQIRKKKENSDISPDIYEDNSPLILTNKSDEKAQISINGSLSTGEIMQIISKCEQEIAQIAALKTAIHAQNIQYNAQIVDFNCQMSDIENNKIKKLRLILDQPDINIYNSYLNGEYINAVKSGDSFARNKLIKENDLNFHSGFHLRKRISDYRIRKESEIINLQSSANVLENQMKSLDALIEKNEVDLNECAQQIRFQQMRIIRYEKLLTG